MLTYLTCFSLCKPTDVRSESNCKSTGKPPRGCKPHQLQRSQNLAASRNDSTDHIWLAAGIVASSLRPAETHVKKLAKSFNTNCS